MRILDANKMGKGNLSWLQTNYHFSFSDYYNPDNINYGVLRVLNDDVIAPHSGFDPHPHRDMEIITYVIDGELTHGDNMGNRRTITRGDIQYMSAGTGVYHSEHNLGEVPLRLLQIWILPDRKSHTPNYGDFSFDWDKRKNHWFEVVSSKQGSGAIKINQDVHLYVLELDKDQQLEFPLNQGRQAYLVQIEGHSLINGSPVYARDAVEFVEETIQLQAEEVSHYLMIEMKLA